MWRKFCVYGTMFTQSIAEVSLPQLTQLATDITKVNTCDSYVASNFLAKPESWYDSGIFKSLSFIQNLKLERASRVGTNTAWEGKILQTILQGFRLGVVNRRDPDHPYVGLYADFIKWGFYLWLFWLPFSPWSNYAMSVVVSTSADNCRSWWN